MRRELGISVEELTTDAGCRKRDAVAVRWERNKTCGLLYAYRTCGISLGILSKMNINYS